MQLGQISDMRFSTDLYVSEHPESEKHILLSLTYLAIGLSVCAKIFSGTTEPILLLLFLFCRVLTTDACDRNSLLHAQ